MRIGRRARLPAVLVSIAACLGVAVTPAGAESPHYHVQYGLAGVFDGVLHVLDTKAPPGANRWSCKPTPTHPNPVVMIPGAGTTSAAAWRTFAPLLANNGYCVFTMDYGRNRKLPGPVANRLGGLMPLEGSAAHELKPFVDKVLAATGAHQVDLVGHSEGTAMPRYYLKHLGGEAKVHRSINIAPLWRGSATSAAALVQRMAGMFGVNYNALGGVRKIAPGLLEMEIGSPYLHDLNVSDPFPQAVRFTSVVTRADKTVVPYTSGMSVRTPNTKNEVLQAQCPGNLADHLFAAYDQDVAQDMLNALDPVHARPVRCGVPPRGTN